MKTPNKTAAIPAVSKAQLAKRLGISRQLLAYHLRSPDAPTDLADTEGWRAYLVDVGREAGLPMALRTQIATQRVRLLKAQAEKTERDNAVTAGTLMSVDEAQKQAREAMGLTFSELERLCRELPPSLAGLDTVSIFKRLDAFKESMRRELKIKFEAMGV